MKNNELFGPFTYNCIQFSNVSISSLRTFYKSCWFLYCLSMWYVVNVIYDFMLFNHFPFLVRSYFNNQIITISHSTFIAEYYYSLFFFSFSIRGVMFNELRRNFYDALLLWYTQWILTDKWSELWRWKYYKFLLCSILYPILEIKPAEYHFCVVFLIEN